MLEFYHTADCPTCGEIEEALREMVLSYKAIVVEPATKPADLPALPALRDNGEIIAGQPAILAHLQEMESFVAKWRLFEADACYCDLP